MERKIVAGLFVLILISLLFQSLTSVVLVFSDDSSLWDNEIKIGDEQPNSSMFMTNLNNTEGSNDWVPIAQLLSEKIISNQNLNPIFTGIFGNSFNNTIFVVLTNTDDAIVKTVQNMTLLPTGIKLRFVKGIASNIQLNEWEKQLDLVELNKQGIPITSISKGVNGALVLTSKNITTDITNKLQSFINGKVPPGAIHIINDLNKKNCASTLKSASVATSTLTTVQGGIPICTSSGYSTLGFVVKSGSQLYAIVAGHAAANGDTVRYSDAGGTIIGTANNIGYQWYRYSDSAIVPFYLDGVSRIWLPNFWPSVNVVKEQDYVQQYVGEWVMKQGNTTGMTGGVIEVKYDSYWDNVWDYGQMYNQVGVTNYAQGGDSGGPVFASINGQIYALGIAMKSGGLSLTIYSPVDGVEHDYGLTFNYNIPVTYFSDNFENFPASPYPYESWTISTGGGGTITKSSTKYHAGSYSVKVQSPTTSAQASAYQNFNVIYGDNDLHFSTYIYVNSSIKNSDYNFIFHAYYPDPLIELLGTGYKFTGSTCYLINRKATGWENVGTIAKNTWVKIEAYFNYKAGKVAYYIGGVYKGQFIPYSWSLRPGKIYIGDDSTTSQSMKCYFDDMVIDNAPFLVTSSPIMKDDFHYWPNNPTYGPWTPSTGNGGTMSFSDFHAVNSVYVQSISTSSFAYAYHTFTPSPGTLTVHFKVSIYIESACVPSDYNYVFHVYDAAGTHELLAAGYYKDTNGYWYLRNYDGITHSWTRWGPGPLLIDQWIQIDAFYYIAEGQVVYYINGGTMGIARLNAAGSGYMPGKIYFGDDSSSAEKMACYFNDFLIDAGPLP
jgi:hypothetical protein